MFIRVYAITLKELHQFWEFWALVLQRPLLAHVHTFGSIQETAEFKAVDDLASSTLLYIVLNLPEVIIGQSEAEMP